MIHFPSPRSPEEGQKLLEALAERNLAEGPVPPLYSSGVKYAPDSPGRDIWRTVSEIRARGAEDCEGLVGWLIAEYWQEGEDVTGTLIPVETPHGPQWHALVLHPDGSLEDPSRVLLEGADEWMAARPGPEGWELGWIGPDGETGLVTGALPELLPALLPVVARVWDEYGDEITEYAKAAWKAASPTLEAYAKRGGKRLLKSLLRGKNPRKSRVRDHRETGVPSWLFSSTYRGPMEAALTGGTFGLGVRKWFKTALDLPPPRVL